MVGVSAMYTLGIKDRVCETRQMENEFNDARRQAVQTLWLVSIVKGSPNRYD